ncbi:mediator of RNA polymerase II transcription subunit 15a [Phalaenopsis equestris]|uniref:mediator of RNA polymerase II transcription subunit 15a n=1 Tax=Phalaenopsis equestris TaxID=78828 RepID=UPI0009E3F4BC|nr:mediator of RNA polymerase II transcription subunit 15a [Phalaenopsis equestris]
MDSTAQTGHNGADWQEEIYLKIQAMKDAHFAELQEFHMKITQRYQQSEMLPHAKQSENFEKLKNFKIFLERVLAFLQISKSSITINLKEKLPYYEKQISGLLNSNRRPRLFPVQQQGQQQLQHAVGHAQSTSQHQPSQVLQVQQHENHGNQVHQLNMPGSITTMQSAVTSGMQHGSMTLPTLAAPAAQLNATNSVQSASELDLVQVNSFGSLQQGSVGSVQQSGVVPLQNSISAAQQTNLNNLSQSSLSGLQPNATSMQNSNVLQQQHLKQQQQEHLMQHQQLKQQMQQRQIQHQLLQQQQRQQLLQPQQPLQQQQTLQQQVHLQQKQQQPSQLPVHQISQLHPMNELNELKSRQGSTIKPGIYQQPQAFAGVQRHNYYHQQLKPGASFPNSSPQNLQASSPQISHHSSPQIDQHALLPAVTKTGTPMHPTGSPFVVQSPSTPPVAPSPIPGDSEKLVSTAVLLPTTGQTTHQQTGIAPLQSQSIAVATPGISASPLLAECSASASERPVERLIKAVQSLSPKVLASAINDISSVVSMIDRIAGSAPGNGSRAAVGEDLVAMTKCRLQARNFMSQDGGATTKKMKRHTSAMPLNNVSSAGSINENFMKFGSLDSADLESTATSHFKRRKLEGTIALHEEIREINQQLIDTVVNICDEDTDSVAAAFEGGGEGTIVKFSFTAVAFSPSLKAHFASMHMSPIAPLRLLVPSSYPKCSPLLLGKLTIEPSKEFEDLSMKAKSMFSISLRCLPQPMSLGEMAGTWDACARKVIVEYAQQSGGGSFSSTYGAWENCVGA